MGRMKLEWQPIETAPRDGKARDHCNRRLPTRSDFRVGRRGMGDDNGRKRLDRSQGHPLDAAARAALQDQVNHQLGLSSS